ncbi:MAG: isoprenylcysteine carboxylmethyltransferase family protein [Candidatus Hodarchaeota archaeon]
MNFDLVFRILFLILFILVLIIRYFYSRKSQIHLTKGLSYKRWKDAAKIEGKVMVSLWGISFAIIYISIILYILALPWLSWTQLPFPIWLRWFGIGLDIVSIPFLIWVHQTLNKYWRTSLEISEKHSLVTTGPYCRVRHPMYTVLITFNIGLVLISANLFVLVGFLIIIILTFARIPKEEQMMLEHFGDEYRAYKQQTGRLLPRFRFKSDKKQFSRQKNIED